MTNPSINSIVFRIRLLEYRHVAQPEAARWDFCFVSFPHSLARRQDVFRPQAMSAPLTPAEIARFQAFLDRVFPNEVNPAPTTTPETHQRRFWEVMRAAVAGHPLTSGLAALDQLAEAIFRGETAPTLTAPAAVFPSPATVNAKIEGTPASDTKAGMASVAPASAPAGLPGPGTTSSSVTVKAKVAVPPKRKASSGSSAKKPAAKKARTSGKSKSSAKTAAVESTSPVSIPCADVLKVSRKAPDSVRLAIEAVLCKAQETGTLPWHLAYPWKGRPFWYDTAAFPDLHRSHWRFWMRNRKIFWLWALHVPLVDRQALASRRKLKLRAVKERLAFLSECIETWGFYGFLEKLDEHPEIFWVGGQPGRTSSDARGTGEVFAEDLASLERRDPVRYKATLENALEPVKVDAFGYPHIRSLLENTEALSLTAAADFRLSDNALARVRFDITSSVKPRATWAGSTQDDPWKTLVNNYNVKQTQVKLMKAIAAGTYKPPTSAPVTKAETKKADWSDLEAEVAGEEEQAAEEEEEDRKKRGLPELRRSVRLDEANADVDDANVLF